MGFSLRLFNPDDNDGPVSVSASWSLSRFVNDWYLPALLADRTRKTPAAKTINKRTVAAGWWSQLMASAEYPDGPPIGSITADDLALFRDRLTKAKYRRGKLGRLYSLSEFSQHRQLEEIQTILNAAGPANGRRIRAGIISQVPTIYLEPPTFWPKDAWTIEEAKAIAGGLATFCQVERFPLPVDRYRVLASASLAFWFYTGHRASTFRYLTFADLVQPRPGHWFLQIARSVKTAKRDRIAVHPQLLDQLQRVRTLFASSPSSPLIPWPWQYRAVADHHAAWQVHAGLDPLRRFSPQAWRRLHAAQIAETGYNAARNLAAGALGHSSASITESHYASIRDAAVLSLPDLF